MKRGRTLSGLGCVLLTWILLGASPLQAQEPLMDQRITDAVEDEFVFDQGVNVNNIDVMTTDGVVTLKGKVDNILAKERAVRLTRTVKGVRSVVDQIRVEPSLVRMDRDIENDVETALLMDRATESYEIDVEVRNNRVVLTGTVDSWQEKRLAERVAMGVKGVIGVTNDIRVQYKTVRSDAEILPEVEERLRWDALVDDALVDVNVENGNVTLSGTVGSAAERSRAYADAWVAGVTSVDDTGLEVRRWARDEDLRENKYVARPDGEIEKAIEDAMLYDPRVLSFEIDADVTAGVATVRGTVDNLKAKRAAAEAARNTVGVTRVINRIRVRPGTPKDAEIAQNIRDAFLRDPFVEKYEVTVAVIDRTAYLAGTVDSYFEKGQADDIASRIYGVEEVKNNIKVDGTPEPLVYDPYLYDEYPYAYDWYDYRPGYTFRSDAAVTEEIADEIFWSPYVDSDDVEVSVENGAATLRGTVDTWKERANATEEAYEGGATWVYNNLAVE